MQTSDNDKLGWADRPAIQQKIRYGIYAVCALLVIIDLLVHRHTYLPVEEMPAFYAFYGFAALVGVVMLAKALRTLVGRGEDYYQKNKVEQESHERGDSNA
jgi:hypothetical protein